MSIQEQLELLRNVVAKAEEDYKTIVSYGLPLISLGRELQPLPMIAAWSGDAAAGVSSGAVPRRIVKDVIVLQRSPSLSQSENNKDNEVTNERHWKLENKLEHEVTFLFGGQTSSLPLENLHFANSEDHAELSDCHRNFEMSELNSNVNFKEDDGEKKIVKSRKACKNNTPILERLKEYPCMTKHKYNPRTKRMNKVIICMYKGCEKEFAKTWNILDHFKVHTGEKPFQWVCWKRAFSQNGNLTKHLKLHPKCTEYLKACAVESSHEEALHA